MHRSSRDGLTGELRSAPAYGNYGPRRPTATRRPRFMRRAPHPRPSRGLCAAAPSEACGAAGAESSARQCARRLCDSLRCYVLDSARCSQDVAKISRRVHEALCEPFLTLMAGGDAKPADFQRLPAFRPVDPRRIQRRRNRPPSSPAPRYRHVAVRPTDRKYIPANVRVTTTGLNSADVWLKSADVLVTGMPDQPRLIVGRLALSRDCETGG
jgi:hypothetical protein